MTMNNTTFLNLEYILKTVLARLSNITINVYDFHIIMYFHLGQIMQNKPNLRNDKMNITIDMTSRYEISLTGSGQKTNPIQTQLKPIQTQFNPIQTQFNPIQSQNKPNLVRRSRISNEAMLIWANNSSFIKYRFTHHFLIKSPPKIAENIKILPFTVSKGPENHEKPYKSNLVRR